MGLIDVRDIEEVGTGPLVEELGLEQEVAERVVERCAAEAKIVAKEQEAKKAADAIAKAKFQAGLFGAAPAGGEEAAQAGAEPGLAAATDAAVAGEEAMVTSTPVENADSEGESEADRMPGPLEAANGGSPEITVHSERTASEENGLSPEQRAAQGVDVDAESNEDEKEYAGDEISGTAALAEGRAAPPATTRDEPA
jgi:hypothetical protein